MTEVIGSRPDAIPAILSGPSSAEDVARGASHAVTLAAKDEELGARALVQALARRLRPYHTSDVRGVEIGGAGEKRARDRGGIVVEENSAPPRKPH